MLIYIAFLLITLVLFGFIFYHLQYFMLFTPTYKRSESLADDCEILSIKTPDGVELEGVCYTPQNIKATLLFFVGRSDDSVGLISKLSQTYSEYRIVSFNYRSYGRSGGKVEENLLYDDAIEIARLVHKHYGDFYLFGFSLGSSIAAYVAQTQKSRGVFLVGAFDSIAHLVKSKYHIYIPKLLRYRFNTLKYVKNIKDATYLFSSKSDDLTYISNAKHLATTIKNLQRFVIVENTTHFELLWHEEVVKTIKEVVEND
jgi:hypothetical protein